jgi:PAS domain S-box-containing protein
LARTPRALVFLEPEWRRAVRASWSLRTHLVVLALACTLPLGLAAAGLGFHFLQQEYRQAQIETETRLRFMNSAVELLFHNVIQDLEVLATSPALQAGDMDRFREHLARANAVYGGIGTVLVQPDGQQIINTRVPPGAPLPKRSVLTTQNLVFATGKAQISDLQLAAAGPVPIISVEVPVVLDGGVRYVLATGLTSEYLAGVLRQHLPEGWTGAIADRSGIVVTRLPDIGVIGQPLIPDLLRRIGEQSAHWIETTSRTGVPNYSSMLRSPELGWSVTIGFPRAVVQDRIWRVSLLLAALIASALGASVLLARAIAGRISRSLSFLESNVSALGHGRALQAWPRLISDIDRMETTLLRVRDEIQTSRTVIERERRLLEAIVESLPIAVLVIGNQGQVLSVNRKLLSLWGIAAPHSMRDLHGVERRRPDGTAYAVEDWPIMRALKHGELVDGEEIVHIARGGQRQTLVVTAAPVRDTQASIIAAVAAVYDVTDLRNALTRQELLLAEVNHRVKNTLATIQSVARLSSRGASSVAEFVHSFEKRLLALSAAYDLLTANDWDGAELGALIRATVAAHQHTDRIAAAGPIVKLSPALTLTLAAALQELTTNAAKYGALSDTKGRVEVGWAVADDTLRITWVESGGPAVAPPTRKGFGSMLLEQMLRQTGGLDARLDYRPGGLRCELSVVLAR